jgi:hypothetical protein
VKESYEQVKARTQAAANREVALYRLRYNKIFAEWHAFRVPQLRHQFGSDREGELIQPEEHNAAVKARGPGGESSADPETAFQRSRL